MTKLCALLVLLLAVCAAAPFAVLAQSNAAPAPAPDSTQNDKYIWLEDVSSERSMAWVKEQNAKTAAALEADPHYKPFFEEALKIAEDPERVPFPDLRGNLVYNQWNDANNQRGLLRYTTIADYLSATPTWHTTLDYDALGKSDKMGWTPSGMACLYPGDTLCMVGLSNGGEDANTQREFDIKAGTFVKDGFHSDHSKQDISWVDANTLLISRDWGADSLTKSGYPYIVKLWKRGTPLTDAKEVFRGEPTDVSASGYQLQDSEGNKQIIFQRGLTFFTSGTYIEKAGKIVQLGLPPKASIQGMLHGRVLFRIEQDWQSFKQGSLLEVTLKELQADPEHLHPTVVFAPTANEFLQDSAITRDYVIVTTLQDVQGRAYIYSRSANGWTHRALPVPENTSVEIATTTPLNDSFFLGITGFLTPSSVWYGDAQKNTFRMARTVPPRFDASNDVVQQFFATSKDGTRVPYFVVHRKDLKLDGNTPALMDAYGGFQVSSTPYYSATTGKLWLERGNTYIVANIRGGGEYGPAWHEAGRKTNRQRIYDDFAAVAQDLFTRKITSPKKLGIVGGSNGGLLMGVEMTQHPDYYGAICIQVPLLDMLRFEHIAAGASWVDEYGSVSVPEERAFLASISPYNQLKPDVNYPTPLIFTTTKDDRVGPQHARKFAAKMAEYGKPFFYDEITEGGHGAGADLRQKARTSAIEFTYFTRQLGAE